MANIIYDTQRTIENNIHKNTLGLFRNNMDNNIELVLEIDNNIIKTISFTNMGAIHTTHINKNKGKLYLFPNNKSLEDIKENPMELYRICNEEI
jgi:hypothetical protein